MFGYGLRSFVRQNDETESEGNLGFKYLKKSLKLDDIKNKTHMSTV